MSGERIEKVEILFKNVSVTAEVGDTDGKNRKILAIDFSENDNFVFVELVTEDNKRSVNAYNVKDVSGFEVVYGFEE